MQIVGGGCIYELRPFSAQLTNVWNECLVSPGPQGPIWESNSQSSCPVPPSADEAGRARQALGQHSQTRAARRSPRPVPFQGLPTHWKPSHRVDDTRHDTKKSRAYPSDPEGESWRGKLSSSKVKVVTAQTHSLLLASSSWLYSVLESYLFLRKRLTMTNVSIFPVH